MKWLKWVKTILECLTIIGPMLKIPKLEKTVEAMSTGIEYYSKTAGNESTGKKVKEFVKAVAQNVGVEDYLHKKINSFTKRLWKNAMS